jgi:hypothetical protein
MLSFDSEAEFNATLDSLENALDTYQLNFKRDHETMAGDELNDYIEGQNIDLEQPLTDFEAQYNFVSLRNELNSQEVTWMNQANPIPEECPQFHSIVSQAERCLWNSNGELMVAGKIYKYNTEDTEMIRIDDGNLNTLALINQGDQNVMSNPNVDVIQINQQSTITSTSSTQCVGTSKNLATTFSYNNSFISISENRIKPKAWTHGKHNLSASTKVYKTMGPNGGALKKYTTLITVQFGGNKYYGCGNTPNATNEFKDRLASSISIEHKRDSPFGVRYSTGYCSMNSSHTAGDINGPYPAILSLTMKYKN